MPPRFMTLAILAFWLAMAGTFLVGEVWPRLAPSEPQLFPVDLVDEAGRQSDPTSWLVFKNGRGGYRADVDWSYFPDDDTFQSRSQLTYRLADPERPRPREAAWPPQFLGVAADSTYFLTRAGRLRRLESTATYHLVLPGGPEEGVEVKAQVGGSPHAGHFTPHLELSFPDLKGQKRLGPLRLEDFGRDAAPVPVLEHGLVLDPLHPPRRLPDLRPGQRWRVTVIDPFAALGLIAPLGPEAGDRLRAAGVVPDAGAYVLDARVLPGTQTLYWKEGDENAEEPTGRQGEGVPCRLVACAGDGPVAALRLWAREGDGLLFKQEAEVWGDTWTFYRRKSGYRMQRVPRSAFGQPK